MKAIIIEDEDIIARVLQGKIKNVDHSIDVAEMIPQPESGQKMVSQ